MIMAKQMQRQAMYLKRRLYCNKSQHLKTKHIWGECGIRYIAISGEVQCGTRPEKGINIARHCVKFFSITAAPAKSVTQVSF